MLHGLREASYKAKISAQFDSKHKMNSQMFYTYYKFKLALEDDFQGLDWHNFLQMHSWSSKLKLKKKGG